MVGKGDGEERGHGDGESWGTWTAGVRPRERRRDPRGRGGGAGITVGRARYGDKRVRDREDGGTGQGHGERDTMGHGRGHGDHPTFFAKGLPAFDAAEMLRVPVLVQRRHHFLLGGKRGGGGRGTNTQPTPPPPQSLLLHQERCPQGTEADRGCCWGGGTVGAFGSVPRQAPPCPHPTDKDQAPSTLLSPPRAGGWLGAGSFFWQG